MSETVRVVARFAVKPEHLDAFVAQADATLVAPTQGEPGCIEYALWQDLEQPTRFVMVEEWESEAALATHLAQPSLQAAVGKLAPMAAEPPTVQRLRRAGS